MWQTIGAKNYFLGICCSNLMTRGVGNHNYLVGVWRPDCRSQGCMFFIPNRSKMLPACDPSSYRFEPVMRVMWNYNFQLPVHSQEKLVSSDGSQIQSEHLFHLLGSVQELHRGCCSLLSLSAPFAPVPSCASEAAHP